MLHKTWELLCCNCRNNSPASMAPSSDNVVVVRQVISLVKRKWKQHRLMKGKSTGRATNYSQSVSVVDHTSLQRPLSPRLLETNGHLPVAKPHRPIFKAISMNLKKNNRKNKKRGSIDSETAQSFL